jgi:hypothetical protein
MLPCTSFFWPNSREGSPHTLYRNEPPAMPRVSDPSVVMNPLQLQTLTSGFRMSRLAHGLAKPRVAWVGRKPGMPDHQEV